MILALYGASGLGMEYLGLAEEMNQANKRWDQIIFVDDNPEQDGKILLDKKVLSFEKLLSMYSVNEVEFIISIGEPQVKEIVYKKLCDKGCKFSMLIHPTSSIGDNVSLGDGVVIQSWNRIPPMSKIGNNVLIQGTTCLGHGIEVGDNSVISSFDFIGGETTIGKDTYIAPHACLRNGLHIGSNAIVGMGSVVTKDIPDNAVAYGNPCEVKRINDSGRVFSK